MAVPGPETLRMTIPALIHLSRLGFSYLSREALGQREKQTNFMPETLRASLERINGVPVSRETAARLTEELLHRLEAEDLGRRFYETLRNGWQGLRLIDFSHPARNAFHSAAELACGRGAGSFRPDITLFINGLPLAMIELKHRERTRSLQAEYDRMLTRSQSREGRRYLQCPQIWAFSDDHPEDPDRLMPLEGEYFATVMANEFPIYAAGGRPSGRRIRLLPRSPEEESRILADYGLGASTRTRDFQRSLSPGKPTHRMLTALFLPERLLFLLRYGIQYLEETDPEGGRMITRRMLTARQLAALKSLIRKANRGWRNWTLPACGAAGEAAMNASMDSLLMDLYPEARLYRVSAGAAAAEPIPPAASSRLIPCESPQEVLDRLRAPSGRRSAGLNIVILPGAASLPERRTGFIRRLRQADPEAIVILQAGNAHEDQLFSRFVPSPVLKISGGDPGP
ncbi:MAG: hypothetical protein IJI21_07100 [Clostridia bacterium]|nr:hypothetical protein [Clostridia bacterium]